MSIFHIELKRIDLNILEQLVLNKTIENRFLEYKGDISHTFFGEDDKGKIDILKDVISFTNSGGGDIVFGISESKGVPTKITGIDISKIDEFKRKLESLMASYIEPRIGKYEFCNPIKIQEDTEKAVLVLRVYQSFNTPHLLSHPKEMRFWYRTNSGNAIMDLQ
jgi:predicted HTH transcriptional regulator